MDLNRWMDNMRADRSICFVFFKMTQLMSGKKSNETSTKNKVVMFSLIGSACVLLVVLCAICGIILGFAIFKNIRSKRHDLKARLIFMHMKYMLSICVFSLHTESSKCKEYHQIILIIIQLKLNVLISSIKVISLLIGITLITY